MATLKSESWDSVTAPAMPTGWSGDNNAAFSNLLTSTSIAFSAPNALFNSNNNASENAWWNPGNNGSGKDNNSGNVQVTSKARFQGDSAVSGASVFARAQAVNNNDCYQSFLGAIGGGLILAVQIGGVQTTLFTVAGDSVLIPEDIWFNMRLTCNGSSIQVRLQRLDTNQYFHNNGNNNNGDWTTFGTTPGDAISLTDSTVGRPTAPGYAGLRLGNFGSVSTNVYMDDFLFESITGSSSSSSPSSSSSSAAPAVPGSARIFQSAIISGLV